MKRFLIAAFVLFFSSAWSDASQDKLTKEPNSVYICTFNVYKLGAVASKYITVDDEEEEDPSSPWGTPQRIKNLANVLAVGEFDLVVLQELRSGSQGNWALSDLAQVLKDDHNLTYHYFMSGYIGQGLIPEAMGFLYREETVKPQPIAGQTTLVDTIAIPGRDLVRTRWAAGDFDFTLISCHLAWGSKGDRDAGYKKVQEILTSPIPSAFSSDPDNIVLGDFNRFGKGYESVKNMQYDATKYLAPNVTFFDPNLTTLKQVTVTSIQGKNVPEDNPQLLSTTVAQNRMVYDIIFLTSDCDEEYPGDATTSTYGKDFGVICFDEKNAFGYQQGADELDHNALKISYSDHRPLWMRFETNTGNKDEGGATVKYVGTAGGHKFHLPGCSTIKGRTITKEWTTRKAALAERGPCGVCKP